MASQDKLRAMFNEMNLEQKGNFIENLKKSLEGSDDVDSVQFLNECIGHYTMEKEYMDSLEAEAEVEAEESAAAAVEAEVVAVVEAEAVVEDVVEVEAEAVIEDGAEPEAELIVDVEPELAEVIEPELTVEEVVIEEAIIEPVVDEEPVVDVTIEPVMDVEPIEDIEPELIIEPDIELDVTPEIELEAVVELEAELEAELDAVAELETDLAAELEAVVELETELELELEMELDLADDTLMVDVGEDSIDELIIEEAVIEIVAIPPAPKSKIDFIALEISELASNIRYKMSVIETISNLLSGTGSDIIEAAKQAKEAGQELMLENTSDYEEKVNCIETSISEFADGIRKDMKVMEAVSDLLEGKGLKDETSPEPKAKKAK